MSGLTNNFGARVVMRADTAAGPVRWANTHEFDCTGIVGDTMLNENGVIDALISFHRGLLCANFMVESVTLSSAADDGKPYAPETMVVRTVMLRGERHGSADDSTVLPLTNCLLVKRLVATGREGSMLLRGLLCEEDIASDPLTGAIHLVEGTASWAAALAADGAAFVSAARAAGAAPVLMKVEAGNVSQVREITGLTAKGHTSKKLNNKYFDRAQGSASNQAQQLFEQYGPAVITQIIQALADGGAALPPLLP